MIGGLAALGAGVAAVTLPGTLELAAVTLGGLLRERGQARDAGPPGAFGPIAVVIPAHDEEAGIGACVDSLRACLQPASGVRVVVVADNCSDATASRARAAGAEVLVRHDPARRGKGYALEHAFEHVLRDPTIAAALVVDADTRVDRRFLVSMAAALAAGADAVQCCYLSDGPPAGTRDRLLRAAFLAFNVARPRGRQRLGLSVGILGNGFGLRRRVMEEVPYTARSVVEDLEYHLRLVRRGFAVRFVEDTFVAAPQPPTDAALRTQRLRWEGGRLRMIREHAPGLAREVARGRLRLLEPLGELLLLPLGVHVGLLALTLSIPFPPTQLYAASALALVAGHVVAALAAGGATRSDYAALLVAPLYVLRKLAALPATVAASRPDQAWVRTPRAD